MIIVNQPYVFYATCKDCGKIVKATGWLRGLHACITPEGIEAMREMPIAQHKGRAAD